MRRIASGDGPTQVRPAAITSVAKRGVLREEAVARVDRRGAGGARGFEDGVAVEVGGREAHGLVGVADVRRVRVGVDVDGDAADAHAMRAAEDAPRDLAAIGDQ